MKMRPMKMGVLALGVVAGGAAIAQYGSGTHQQHYQSSGQSYQSSGQGYQATGQSSQSGYAGSTDPTYGTTQGTTSTVSQEQVDAILAGWMDRPREVARTMIAKYGLPNGATPHMLVWHNNGMWRMSVLENVMIPHNFPVPHHDMLYQYIDHSVPESFYDDLARFDGSVIVERTRGTLGARCDMEAANFLAVNLSHDIMTNKRSVGEAREFYAEAVSAMKANSTDSEQSRYLSEFTFDVMETNMGDPDTEWTGSYYASMEDEGYQEQTVAEELDAIEEERSSRSTVRMTGLPGRPDWDHKMGW